MIRVFIYDDNVDRRESLKAMVELSEDLLYCGEAQNCSAILTDLQASRPDVLLMDINMPEVNGIEGLKLARTHYPNIKVLMQTVFDDSEKVFESIRNGANGYVLKKDTPQRLTEAIREVYNGGAFMNPGIAQKVLSFFAPQAQAHVLTSREQDVLRLLAQGHSYKMAASDLGISYHTLNTHVKKIYEKLHVQSLGEALAYYYKHVGGINKIDRK